MAAHRFRWSADLEKGLVKAACPLGKAPARIVEQNQDLMKKGGFPLPASEQQLLPHCETSALRCPGEASPAEPRFAETEVCVANIDTLSAALFLGEACALNFANAEVPGGGYLHGARAQEEDLCRLLPQLHPALMSVRKEHYPIEPDVALLTPNVLAVRQPGTYKLCQSLGDCTIVTSAMPCFDPPPDTPAWDKTVAVRMRAVLHAAKCTSLPNLVLGAWGCGAFGNPADSVATLFNQILMSQEFRGAFAKVVFAIIDPRHDGNLEPFARTLRQLADGADEQMSDIAPGEVPPSHGSGESVSAGMELPRSGGCGAGAAAAAAAAAPKSP